MKLKLTTSWLFILANAIFWLIFGANFALQSYTYKPHTKAFEEHSPPFILLYKAFPFGQYMSPLMRTTRFVQAPSFCAATPINIYFSRRGIVVDQLYWGISVGGYYLITVCLLSFLQWYLIGSLVDYLKRFWSVSSGKRDL